MVDGTSNYEKVVKCDVLLGFQVCVICHRGKKRSTSLHFFDCLLYSCFPLSYVDEFILCCYAGEAAAETVKCHSPKDEFSSCFDLMKNRGVQVCVWILGLTALLGNLIVLLMRVVAKEDNKVQSILLTNLAMSDLLMGIYLLIIAIKDVQWQGEYFLHDFKWRSGIPCALTGVLSMVSSEVSVLMLTVLTTDRLICVVFPFKVRRMNRSVAYAVVGGVWVLGTMLAVIPILGLEYFYDKKRSVGFYGKSAVLSSSSAVGGEDGGMGICCWYFHWAKLCFVCLHSCCLHSHVHYSQKHVKEG